MVKCEIKVEAVEEEIAVNFHEQTCCFSFATLSQQYSLPETIATIQLSTVRHNMCLPFREKNKLSVNCIITMTIYYEYVSYFHWNKKSDQSNILW